MRHSWREVKAEKQRQCKRLSEEKSFRTFPLTLPLHKRFHMHTKYVIILSVMPLRTKIHKKLICTQDIRTILMYTPWCLTENNHNFCLNVGHVWNDTLNSRGWMLQYYCQSCKLGPFCHRTLWDCPLKKNRGSSCSRKCPNTPFVFVHMLKPSSGCSKYDLCIRGKG